MSWLALLAALLVVVSALLLKAAGDRRTLGSLGRNLTRYAAENRALGPAPDGRIILFGDCLAEAWDIGHDFPELHILNRGIAGETTLHLLARFKQDVLDLEPRVIILLAGRNDPLWKFPLSATQDHFQLLARLATKHEIELIISSLLPVRPGRPARRHSPAGIQAMNAWLREFAQARGLEYVDFHAVMADSRGWLRRELTEDGVHPNADGYRAMAAVLCPVLERVLERTQPRSGRAAKG